MEPKKGGPVNFLEPIGGELLEAYPEILQKFVDAGWFDFYCNFQGYHEEVSMLFTQNFDGFKTWVGDVLIYVTKHSIRKACHLPMHGERWWKKGELFANLCKQFLVPKHYDPD
jgi:hypothetical protein